MQQTDEELIQQYIQGNTQAMEIIFQRYKLKMFNYALRFLANRADAEDVVADTFVAIVSRKYTYQPEVKFSTWLYTVVHHAAIDRLRRRKRNVSMWFQKESGGELEEFQIPDPKQDPGQDAQKEDMKINIQMAVNKLPADQKEALILREYQDLSYEEIGQILNCSLSNVKVLIFRAREQLRKDLSAVLKEGF
ncbi:MAG: hypothetical protein A2Z88_11400 [Omnitrophica WOR_2 bacterium GWA2_47_8]|nr:MAG: hypothetical protein A2Z88_11400 [Omnitrophica WOR_2 bacterium GWA2_47_8]